MGIPLDANGVAIASARHRRFEVSTRRTADVVAQIESGGFRERLVANAHLHGNIVYLRRHIFGQIVQSDRVDRGLDVSRVQHGLPLGVACRGNSHLGSGRQVHWLPRTPVAVGIVDVAAARQQIDIAGAAKFRAAPTGKNLGIENIAFVRTFALRARTENKNLAEVTAGGIESAAGSLGETGDL